MRLLRRIYLRLYILFKHHYPVGTLVRYHPTRSLSLGIDWLVPGLKAHDIGVVVGAWDKFRSPGFLAKGNLVLFDGKTYDMEEWELEVIDEIQPG